MRTTIDIDKVLLQEIIERSGAKTKKDAILIAIRDYLRFKKFQELKGLIGNYDNFALTLEELKEMRNDK
jgi:Arc/MetJ family transcription regulator